MSALAQILIVVTGVMSLTVLTVAYFTITPVFLEIYENPNDACQANTNCMNIFDRQYNIWFLMFAFFLVGIFAVMYARASRKDSIETSYSGDEL
jgi:uncharacterized membrane protein YjgN (DUF898 family)